MYALQVPQDSRSIDRESVDKESVLLVSPIISTSPSTEVGGPITGIPASGGSVDPIPDRRSDIPWRALYGSTPHSCSTHTTENPAELEERTRLTPGAPPIAVSMG